MDKGKGIAETSSPPRASNPSAPKHKGKRKKNGPTDDEYFAKFSTMKFEQGKFVDPTVLRNLGIYEDVMQIFKNMGLTKFMSMREGAEQNLTCQFLSSMSARFFDKEHKRAAKYGFGILYFKIEGKPYKISFRKLCTIFGFEEEGMDDGQYYSYSSEELSRLWDTIASESYAPGRSKLSSIRNPAIRYAHKALVHMLYAKVEYDTVASEEMELMGIGLKPFLPMLKDGHEFEGPTTNPCLASILVRHFLNYAKWAFKTRAKKAFLGLGWLVTPILRAKGIPFSMDGVALQFMDEAYLQRTRFLKRISTHSYAFEFFLTQSAIAKIILPNQAFTSLNNPSNVAFLPPQDVLMSAANEEPPEEHSEPVQGPSRYDFTPYDGPSNSPALAQAHQHIKLLQKTNKWQNRSMRKMAKVIKGLKKTVKTMGKTIEALGCKGDGATPMVLETELAPHRLSTKDKGKRKARSPTPSSSNESISLDTESSSSPSQTF